MSCNTNCKISLNGLSVTTSCYIEANLFIFATNYKTNRSKHLSELPFTAELAEYTTPSGHVLSPPDNARDLGVSLFSDYTWNCQIGELISNTRNTASWVLGVFKDRSLKSCCSCTMPLHGFLS